VRRSFGSPILSAAIRLLTPFLMLFAAYVAIHGHTSPGGGFQAGALLGAALILIRLVHGHASVWGPTRQTLLSLACGGAFAYAGIGMASMLAGMTLFDYSALPLPGSGGERRGIASLCVELAVLVTVSSVMTLIFDALSLKPED